MLDGFNGVNTPAMANFQLPNHITEYIGEKRCAQSVLMS